MPSARRLVAATASALLLATGGCSAEHASTASPSDADGGSCGAAAADAWVGCACDPRAETYAPSLTKNGESGAFQFVLTAANPAPPAIRDNTWTIELLDASGAAVSGAAFSVKTWMPDHMHGSPLVAGAAPSSPPGTYTVTPLYLFMNGLWQVTLSATAAGVSDHATFTFCIGG